MKRPYQHHGLKGHKIYNLWRNIKERCHNERNPSFERYGAKGVRLSNEWMNNVQSFYDYVTALDHYDEPGMSIDRIKNNKGYERGNLRWADAHTQNTNKGIQKSNTTGFVGVAPVSGDYNYYATTIGGKYIGTFHSIIEAAEARNNYIIKHGLWEYPIQQTLVA